MTPLRGTWIWHSVTGHACSSVQRAGLQIDNFLVQAGLTGWSLASPAIVSFDDETSGKIARAVVNFWSHCVADEIRTNRSYSDALPGKFAAVLQDDPAKVARELVILREWLDILEEFEIAMDGNEWLVTFHQSLISPVSRWVAFHVMSKPSSSTRLASAALASSRTRSIGCERRQDKAEKQSPMTQWQPTMPGPFMKAYDKRPLQLSADSDTLHTR